MTKPVTIAIVGAGMRGETYARFALQNPEICQVVAVAEPRPLQRETLAGVHRIPAQNEFDSWESLAAAPRLADAVVIATQDRMHLEPMLALAPKGYAVLLEKPMATNLEDSEKIVACAKAHGNIFAVGHVLLYTDFTMQLKALIRSGVVGDIVTAQHLEPVGWWHQAHSFVRGNWSKESDSTFMLLSKCCHDVDWLRHIMDRPCRRVSSFGSLVHFRPSQRPAGAADRCIDCSVESTCPYSAKRFYLDQLQRDQIHDYCVSVITDDATPEGVMKALREGPYGRCVYACDNDVVDNQVVNFDFADGATASMTMTAFTPAAHRKTRLCGTRGFLETDSVQIHHFDFATETMRVIESSATADSSTAASGHGGGDYGLMYAFVKAVATGDQRHILSGPDETIASHRMVFAAELSRRTGRVVEL